MRQALLRLAYLAARAVWFVARPLHTGAVIALWQEGKVLLVYQGYRRSWSFPGGGVGARETPKDAALRELREELGLALDPALLRHVLTVPDDYEHRRETVHIFEAPLAGVPKIDRFELLDLALLPPDQALARPLPPHVREYLVRAAAKETPLPAGEREKLFAGEGVSFGGKAI
jgi:8-oxo-dGTP pyrophosphatase MutT (NUDIX family)